MPEPTLNELIEIGRRADPELGTGTPAVVYDDRELIRTLNNAAQYKAENDWRKYNAFMGNLKDVYKDLNKISEMQVMTKDRDILKKQMGEIVAGISKDPRGFFGGGAKYQETLSKIAKLQSDATESKANNLYDFAHRQYFYRNPEIDTPENRALIDGYALQPLGARNPYLLQLPGMYDGGKMAEYINQLVKTSNTKPEGGEDSPFIDEVTTISYDPDKYRTIAEKLFEMPNERGQSLRQTMQKRFDMLPPDLKQAYGKSDDPVKSFYLEDIMSRIMPGSSSVQRKSNPNYLERQRLAEQTRHNKAQEWLARNAQLISQANASGAAEDDKLGAASVLNEAIDIIKKGQTVSVYDKTLGKNVNKLRIGDPFLLQRFGNIDKEGNITNVPNFVEYNTETDQLELGYYKRDPDDPDKKTNVYETKKIDQRTWVKEIAKRTFPNKDIGTINNLVDRILTQSGNSLYGLTKPPAATTQTGQSTGNTLEFPDGSTIDIGKERLTDEEIQEAINAGAKRK